MVKDIIPYRLVIFLSINDHIDPADGYIYLARSANLPTGLYIF